MVFLLVAENLADFGDGVLDRAIDDFVLISMLVSHLFIGRFQAAHDCLIGFGSARSKPTLQLVLSTWMDK